MPNRNTSIRLQVLVERLKVSESRVLLLAIKEIEISMVEALSHDELSGLTPAQISRLITLSDSKLKFLGAGIMADYQTNLLKFVKLQNEIENKLWGTNPLSEKEAIKAALETPLGIDGPNRGRNVGDFIDNWWKEIRSSSYGALKRGAFERRSNLELKKEILGTRATHFSDGLLSSLKRNAVTTSNTAIQHTFSSVREALLSRNKLSVMWSALFEKNVCARCRSLDGRIFKEGQGPRSPLHSGCRCIMEPVTGDVEPHRETFYGWLKGQPKDDIVEALGPSRAQLFMSGGISAQRFSELQLDKRFEPLTLEELRALAPSIFKRAGI